MAKPDVHRLIAFQQLLFDFRAIERRLHIPPGLDEVENDVEHSYNLAMFAWFLADYFPKLDRDKLIRYALVHDLVEVYAGDTFAYNNHEALRQKTAREAAAHKQLMQEWPDFPSLSKTITTYEARTDHEAKFIYALDKLLPALVDYMNEGRGWHYHGITFADFCAEKHKKMPISPDIYAYMQELISILETQQHLFPAPSQQR